MDVVAPADAGRPTWSPTSPWRGCGSSGSSWVRRSERRSPACRATRASPLGEVVASVVSTENPTDLGYKPPPGVIEGVARSAATRARTASRSTRVAPDHRPPARLGDRAEAYLRFPTGPQNALAYRTLRLWARGRGAGWEEGELEAFVKLGSDDRNFYLFRARAHTTVWTPELEVDLETWRRLRAESSVGGCRASLPREPPTAVRWTRTRMSRAMVPISSMSPTPASTRPTWPRSRRCRRVSTARRGPARWPRRSSGSTTFGCVAGLPSWAPRWRWTRGWPPPTSATSTSRIPARTGSSARSTPIPRTAPPARCSSAAAGGSTGSCRRHSASPSPSPPRTSTPASTPSS